MGLLGQLGLLLGKDFTLLARQPVVLTFQCLWPLTLVLIVAVVRQAMPPEAKPTCSYPTRTMPSSGVMNFMQSFVCNINNKCTNVDDTAAKAAEAGARISKMFKYLEPLTKTNDSSESVLRKLPKSLGALEEMKKMFEKPEAKKFLNMSLELGNFFKDREKVKQILVYDTKVMDAKTADILLSATVNLKELYHLIGYIDFKGIACSATRLKQYLIFMKGADVQQVALELCRIDTDKIPDLVDRVQHQLDVQYIFKVASRIAGFVGAYDVSAAFDDVASMFDSVLTFDMMKDVKNAIPTIIKISSMLRRTGKLIDGVLGKDMSEVNTTFAVIGTVMNQIDPLVSSIIHDTMPNSTIWTDIKDVFFKVQHVVDIISVVFKQIPNVKLTFGGIFKNATSVEEILSKWLSVEGPQVIKMIMNTQIDQAKMNTFLYAMSTVTSQEDLYRVACDRPGITSIMITMKKDVLDRYIKERVCRLNETAIMAELLANFDIQKIILSFKSKTPTNWNWTELVESGRSLVDTVMKHWKNYEELIKVLGKLELKKIWDGVLANDTQDGIDQLVVGIAQSFSTLEAYVGSNNPTLRQINELVDLTHEMLSSILDIFHSGMLHEEPMLNVTKEMARNGPEVMMGMIKALFKPETFMMISKDPKKLEAILCNEKSARAFLNLPASVSVAQIQAQLCNNKFQEFIKRWQAKLDFTKYEKRFMEIFGPKSSNAPSTKSLSDSVLKGYDMYKMTMNISASVDTTLRKWNNTLMSVGASFSTPKWEKVSEVLLEQMSYSSVAMVVETLGPMFENSSAWQSTGQAIKMVVFTIDLMNSQLSSTTDALLSKKKLSGEMVAYLTNYGPDVMKAVGRMMMDPVKSSQFFMLPNLTQALCDESTVRRFLDIPRRVPLKEMLELFCKLDTQRLMYEVNTAGVVIEKMIRTMNTTSPPDMDWKAAVRSGKKLYDMINQMKDGTWNMDSYHAFLDMGKKMMRYQTVFDELIKEFENATQTDMVGVYTTILKSMEALEAALPADVWKYMKVQIKMMDMIVVEMNEKMNKMTKNGIRLGDLFEAPSLLRLFINATLSLTPDVMDGVMNLMLKPDKMIAATFTMNPNPCGGKFFTQLFPNANPAYVSVVEKMICYSTAKELETALMQEPFIMKIINFTQSVMYFERTTSPPEQTPTSPTWRYNHTSVVHINQTYRDIPLNFSEVGLHLFETYGNMERLIANMTGPYLPDVPGFNLTAIELTTQKMIMQMRAMDWAKYTQRINNLSPLITNVTMVNVFRSLPPGVVGSTLPWIQLANECFPVVMKRMEIFLGSNLTIADFFKGFPVHKKLVSLLPYLPQITEVFIASVDPDNIEKLMKMTYPAPFDMNKIFIKFCTNDAAKYFTVPRTANEGFRYVQRSVCEVFSNLPILLQEFYSFTSVDVVLKWQQMQMLNWNSTRTNSSIEAILASYTDSIFKWNALFSAVIGKLANPSSPALMATPLWLDSRVWTKAIWNVYSTLVKLESMNTDMEQLIWYQLKVVRGMNPHLRALATAGGFNSAIHSGIVIQDAIINTLSRFIANRNLTFEDLLKGSPELQKIVGMVGYLPQVFEILTLTMLSQDKSSKFITAVSKMDVLSKICRGRGGHDEILVIPPYLMADFQKIRSEICQLNFGKVVKEVNALPIADLFGSKLNDSFYDNSPANFTEYFAKSWLVGHLMIKLSTKRPTFDLDNFPTNGTVWYQMIMRILNQLNNQQSNNVADNEMLGLWLQEMVKTNPMLNQGLTIANLVMEFLVKELYPMIGANLTMDDLVSPAKYPTLAKLTGLLDYSPQIVQVLIATSNMKSGQISALFATPNILETFCKSPLDKYLAIPTGTELAMEKVKTTICGLDQAKLVAEFNSRVGNVSVQIEKVLASGNTTSLVNVTEYLTNANYMQQILMAMIAKPPKWVGLYKWMNATLWDHTMTNLANMWGDGSAITIINQALGSLQQSLGSLMPLLANNTEAMTGLKTTQQVINWVNKYLNQGDKWNPFSLIEGTTELNKLWEMVKKMPTVMDMILNTMTDPVKSNALINGLTVNPAAYLAKICQTPNWSNVFNFDTSLVAEVAVIRQALCSLNMTKLEAEVKMLTGKEFGAIISAASGTSKATFSTTDLFSSIKQMNSLIQKLVGKSTAGKFPFAFNPADYPLFNETIWKNTIDRFLFEMQKTGNSTDSLIAILGQFDWVFTTLLVQTGAASGDIQKALQAASSLTGMYNDIVKALLTNSFSMDKVLGKGSEVQKLTKLFNALPDITGMIMLAQTNTVKSGPFLAQLASMNSSADFVMLCKQDWNNFLTMPKDSSITVKEVQTAVCSINVTLLEQQLSMEFGTLVQLIGGANGTKTPFNFGSLIAKATQTAALTSKLVSGVNISTSSYPWANGKRWMAIIEDYNKQTQNTLAQILNGIEGLGNLLVATVPRENLMPAIHIMNHVMEMVLTKLGDLNQTHIVLSDLFKSPELKKLFKFLDNTPELYEVLTSSMEKQTFWTLVMEKNITKAFLMLCHPLSDINQYFKIPKGSSANLAALKTEFCKINIAQLVDEAKKEFKIPEIAAAEKNLSPVNWTMTALKFYQLYQQIDEWVKKTPEIELPRWVNGTQWIQVLIRYGASMNTSEAILENVMKAFVNMIPLFEKEPNAVAFFGVLNTIIKMMKENLKQFGAGQDITLYDIVKNVPQLKDLVKLSLNLSTDVLESMLYTTFLNPSKLMSFVMVNDSLAAMCHPKTGLASAITVPTEIKVDADEIQRIMCSINITTLPTDITSGFHINQVIQAITLATQKQIKSVNWTEFVLNSGEVVKQLDNIIKNPPKFKINLDENAYKAIIGQFMQKVNLQDARSYYKLIESIMMAFQGMPAWREIRPSYSLALMITEYINTILGRVEITNGKLELMSLVKNSGKLKNILMVTGGLTSDFANGFLSTQIKVDKIVPFMMNAAQSPDSFFKNLVCSEALLNEYFLISPSIKASMIKDAFCGLNKTHIMDEVSKEFDIMVLMQKISQIRDGSYTFSVSKFLQATTNLVQYLMGVNNVTGITFNNMDLLRPINMTAALDKSMLQFIANLPKLEIETFTKILEQIMPLIEKQDFWNQTKTYLVLINTIADVLNKKVSSLISSGLTLDTLFKDSTNFKNYLNKLLASAPQLVSGIMTAKVDIAKILSVNDTESLQKALCGGALKFTNVDVTAVRQALCKSNLTAVFEELKLEVDYDKIYAEIVAISSMQPAMTPFNWTTTIYNMRDLATNFGQLAVTMKLPTLGQFLNFTGNMSAWEQQFLQVFSQPIQLDDVLIKIIGSTMESLTPMLAKTLGPVFPTVIKAYEFMVKVVKDRLLQLRGRPITLNTLFNNATQVKMIIQTAFGLDVKMVETLLQSTVQSDKLMQLIAAPERICATGLSFITPPAGATLDLASIRTALCKYNATVLVSELAKEIKLDELLMLVNVTMTNPNSPVDWTSAMLESKQLIELITSLVKAPPTLDPTFIALFNLTKYSPAIMAYISRITQLAKSMDINGLLSQYESLLLGLLAPLKGTEALKVTLQAYHISTAVLDFTNTMLSDVTVTNGVVNIGGLFKDSQRLKDIMEVVFGLGPNFVSGIMASAISVQKLTPLISQGAAAIPLLEKIACDEGLLKQYFTFHATVNVTEVKQAFCGINSTLLLAELENEFSYMKLVSEINMALKSPSPNINFGSVAAKVQQLIANINKLTGGSGVVLNDKDLVKYFNFSMNLDQTLLQFVASLPPLETATFAKILEEATAMLENTEIWKTMKGSLNVINIIVDVMNNKIKDVPASKMTIKDLFKNSPSVQKLLTSTFALTPVLLEKINPHMAMQIQTAEDLKQFLCDVVKNSSHPSSAATICSFNENMVLQELLTEINFPAIMAEINKIGPTYTAPFNWTTTLLNAQYLVQNFMKLAKTIKLPTVQEFFLYTGNFTEWVVRMEKAGLVSMDPSIGSIVSTIGYTLDSIMPMLLNASSNNATQEFLFVIKSYDYFVKVIKDRLVDFTGGKPITLEKILKNADKTRELLRLVFKLDAAMIEAILTSQVNLDKLMGLLIQPDLDKTLCKSPNSVSRYFSLATGQSVTIDQLQKAICKVNITILMEELSAELDIPKFVQWTMAGQHGKISINWTSTIMNSHDLVKTLIQLFSSESGILDSGLLGFMNTTQKLGPVFEKWLQMMANTSAGNVDFKNIVDLLQFVMTLTGNSTVSQDMMKFFYGVNFYLEFLNQKLTLLTTQPVTLDTLFSNMTQIRSYLETQLTTEDVLTLLNAEIMPDKLLALIRAVNSHRMTVVGAMCQAADLVELPANYTGNLKQWLKNSLCSNATAILEELKENFKIEEFIAGLSSANSFNLSNIISSGEKFTKLLMQLLKVPPSVGDDLKNLLQMNGMNFSTIMKELEKMDPARFLSLVSKFGPMLESLYPMMGGVMVNLHIQISTIVKQLGFLADKGFNLEKFMTNSTALEAFIQNMWSSTTVDSIQNGPTFDYLIRPQFVVFSGYPVIKSLVCDQDALSKLIHAPAYFDMASISGAMCNKNGSEWVDGLLNANVSKTEIVNLASKLQLYLFMKGKYPVPQMPSTNWKKMEDDLRKLAEIFKNIGKLPAGFIPSFNDSYWKPFMDAYVKSLEKGMTVQALSLLNYLDPLLRDQEFWNTMKKYLNDFAAFTKYINKMLGKLQGSGKQLQLVKLFPNKDAVVRLLSPSMTQGEIAEFLTAVVIPHKYLELLQAGSKAEMFFCNSTVFDATFRYPAAVDSDKIQQVLCASFRNNTLRLQQFMSLLDIKSLVKEIGRLTGTNINQPLDKNPFEYFVTQMRTFVQSISLMTVFIPGPTSAEAGKYFRALESALWVMLEQTPVSFGRMCDATQALLKEEWFREAKPVDVAVQLATETMSSVLKGLIGPDICSATESSITHILRKFLDMNVIQNMLKLDKVIRGEVNETFQCSRSINAGNSIYETFNKLINGTHNGRKISKCVEDFFTRNLATIEDVQSFFGLMIEVQSVMKEDIFNSSSSEFGAILETVISGIVRQQPVSMKITEIFKNYTSIKDLLLKTAKITPDMINTILHSTINLDVRKFQNMTDANVKLIVCSPVELSKYIQVPPVFKLDFDELSERLCTGVQNISISQITDAINLAKVAIKIGESNNPSIVASNWLDKVSDHLSDIFKYGGSLFNIVDLVMPFDVNKIVKMLPQLQEAILNNTPEKVFDSLVSLIQDFEIFATTPEMKQLVKDLTKFASGLRNLNLFKFIFNVRMRDLIKNDDDFNNYLIKELGMTPNASKALLDSSFSFIEMELIAKKNITSYFCDPVKLKTLLIFDKTINVKAQDITDPLCSTNINKTAEVMEKLIKELDIGELMKTFVSMTADQMLSQVNMTTDDLKDTMEKLKPLADQLDKYLKEFSELAEALPAVPGKTGQQGGPSVARLESPEDESNMLSSLSRMLCGSPDAMTFKDEFGITDSIGQTETNSKMMQKELADLPAESCADIYRVIRNIPGGSIVWAYIKPLMLGKIPFSPDTPITRKIMSQANTTFQEIEDIKQMLQEFAENGGGLGAVTNNSGSMQTVKKALSNPFVSGAIEEMMGMKADDLINMMEGMSSVRSEDLEKMLYYSRVMLNYSACIDLDRYVGVANEAELENVAKQLGKDRKVMAAIVFLDEESSRKKRSIPTNDSSVPKHVKYKIRLDIDNTPPVHLRFQEYSKTGPADDFASDLRYLRAFVPLQDMVDKAIVSAQIGKPVATPSLKVKQFPYPCYNKDSFLNYFTFLLPLLMVLAWFVQIAVMIRATVAERETGLCETLRVMGMSSVMNFLSWFFSSMLSMTLMSVIMVVILKVSNLLPYSNWLILIFFFLAFSLSTTMMCFLVSAFFMRANLAALVGMIIFVLGYLPFTVVMALNYNLTWSEKTGASLLSPSAFSFGASYVSRYEGMGIGIQWHNIENLYPGDSITFSWACIMMVIDSAIYFLIGWYVRNVFPGKYGMPQPFYFPFLPRYWGCYFCPNKEEKSSKYVVKNAYRNPIYEDNEEVKASNARKKAAGEFSPVASTSSTLVDKIEDPGSFRNESEPAHLPIGISIHHLTKKYKKKKVAVNNLSMNFYEGQITALLGQNGAGKTTTINMLCGIFPPSSGSAYINGKSIWTDYSEIRKTLGYCPQHNVLFDTMTVKEHLKFFGKLKGIMKGKELKEDISSLLDSMGLRHFKNEKVRNLSGGMKRRLSVAIAFVGGSRVVILDEPTAGVDPAARRNIWDLIVKHKQGRTILLTTHHLDEADILADRIAVMHQGKLLCTGSSMFLKNRFGRGYLLTMSKAKPDPEVSADSSFDSGAIIDFITRELPGAYIEEEVGSEMRVLLPSNQRSSFHKFFGLFNEALDDLMISSYGVSDTTLEEVFLCLCHLADSNQELTRETVDEMHHQRSMKQVNGSSQLNESMGVDIPLEPVGGKDGANAMNGTDQMNASNGIGEPRQERKKTVYKFGGIALKFIQFWSLVIKRFHHHRRYLRGFISHLILPCLFIAFAMWTTTVAPRAGNSGARQMSPALYGGNVFYKNANPINFNDMMAESLLGPPGLGTNCMPGSKHILHGWAPMSDQDLFNLRNVAVCRNQTVSPPFTTPSITPTQAKEYRNPPKCRCEEKRQVCPKYAEGFPPPRKIMNSSETMYKLNDFNITDWILRTYEDFPQNRFGGWEFGNTQSAAPQDQTATVWFNNKALHSLPSYVNGLSNAVQRRYAKEILGDDPAEYGITTYNHPLPMTREQLSAETILQRASHLGTSIVILVALCFIPASFIIYPVQENLNQEKRLQFVYGIGPVLYWLTSIIWDMLMFAIPVGCCVGIMYGFDVDIYTARENLQASAVLMVLFGWGATPFCYMMVRGFKDSSTAFMTSFIVVLFIGITLTLCTFLLGTFAGANMYVKDALYYLEYIFLISPSFALGDGFIKIARNQILTSVFKDYGEDVYKSPFTFDMLGWHMVALGVQGFVFLIITMMMEARCDCCSNSSRSVSHGNEDDDDVVMETRRVMTGGAKNDILVLKGLSKAYRSGMHSIRAVNHVSVGIPKGDCFGLLGLNGAGKTTTFKMLTGEVRPSSGKASLFNKNITHCTANLASNVGYCPQFDALDRQLTGDELLRCYARLKGITGADADRVIKDVVKQLNLQDCVKKVVSKYSGGMRRRLSIAVAMIGDPQLILLDEPTAGMDPQMRRYVWTSLMNVIHDDRSVVITSHKMDECEFLCTRLAIMVNGEFRCLGSPQHLRTKFGEGYTLTVRLIEKASPVRVTEFVQSKFPGSVLKDQHFRMLEFNIPSSTSQLPNIFGMIEMEKHILGVEDYSVNQTTLDQVFVNFSRDQDDGVIDDDDQSDIEAKPFDTFHTGAFDNNLYEINPLPTKDMEEKGLPGYENQIYDNRGASQYQQNVIDHSGIGLSEMSTKL